MIWVEMEGDKGLESGQKKSGDRLCRKLQSFDVNAKT